MKDGNWRNGDGWVLKGLADMYRAGSQDGSAKENLLAYLDATVSPAGEIMPLFAQPCGTEAVMCGKALFFALDETKEERYRAAAKELMERINAMEPSLDAEWLYAVEPFRAEYDTRFGDKQTYKLIARRFREARDSAFNEEVKLYAAEGDDTPFESHALMMMALADTVENMDIQLYEHYRALADLFLEAARGLLPYQDQETGLFIKPETEKKDDTACQAMLLYAVKKGVRLGLLDEEKYLPRLTRAWESLSREIDRRGLAFDAWTMGPCIMASAEFGRE